MINDVMYRCHAIIEIADDLRSKADEQRDDMSAATLKKLLKDLEEAEAVLAAAFERLD